MQSCKSFNPANLDSDNEPQSFPSSRYFPSPLILLIPKIPRITVQTAAILQILIQTAPQNFPG